MRGLLTLSALTLVLTSVTPAQKPRDEDMHERLTRRLEQTIGSQKQVLEDIRNLLQESLRNNRNNEAERVRLEMKADLEGLKAQLARQSADVQVLQKDLATAKVQMEDLENKNRSLEAESDTLRSEIASQALLRQRLQQEVSQLRTLLEDEKKKNAKPKPNQKPGGDKKNG